MNAMSMFGRMNYGMTMISQFLVGGAVFEKVTGNAVSSKPPKKK